MFISEYDMVELHLLSFLHVKLKNQPTNFKYETAPAGPVRHLSDRSIRSMDRSEIFDISGTGPRSLISKQMN